MEIPNLAPRPQKAGPPPWLFLDEFRVQEGDKPHFHCQWPSLPTLFDITTWRYPDRPCWTIFDPNRITLTYQEAREKIYNLASWFRSAGLQAGDRIAVCGKNSPEWALTYLACLRADCIIVPLDQGLNTKEIEVLLKASGAKVFASDTDKRSSLPGILALDLEEPGPGNVQTLAGRSHQDPGPSSRQGSDVAAILFTSGTTGDPKGVMLTHDNIVADAFLAQYFMPLYPTDVFYALLPIHHSYTMLAVFIESLSVGAETVFGKRLVVAQILKDLKQAQVTMFLGVPMLFNKLLAGIDKGIKEKGPVVHGIIQGLMFISGIIKALTGFNPGKRIFKSILSKASLDSIRICISGGGPLAPSTFRAYNQLGLDFVQGYGLTETSPIITLNPVWRYKTTSVGAILPLTAMKVLDPDGQGRGELAIKGPMVMAGYYNKPEATAEIMTADGWLKTGDVGWIDGENYVYLTGRAKNLIVTEGGKNVYPEEIENAFQLYFEIDQIMVRGYLMDPKAKSEGIEVLLYPVQDGFKDPQGLVDQDRMRARMETIVAEVNQGLHPHQRIHKVTVLQEPMEMTSTKKIRRHMVE